MVNSKRSGIDLTSRVGFPIWRDRLAFMTLTPGNSERVLIASKQRRERDKIRRKTHGGCFFWRGTSRGMSSGAEGLRSIFWEEAWKIVPPVPSWPLRPALAPSLTLPLFLILCLQLEGMSTGQRTIEEEDRPIQIAYQTGSWGGPLRPMTHRRSPTIFLD